MRYPLVLLSLALVAGCKKASDQPKPAPAQAPATPPAPPADPNAIPPPPDVKAPPADAEKTASGLAFKILTKGTGSERPTPQDLATVHYTGWTTDGRMFDSSVKRGEPAPFRVDRVIKGWTEGLLLMVQGEKRRLWIPSGLAYGDNPGGGRPGGMLVFDVELLGITKPPPPPEDVAGPPKKAKKTKSGLAYVVLKKGTGKEHPKASNMLELHFSGWTKDGKLVESTALQGQPVTMPVQGPIPGWSEATQLMVAGEKPRFWFPGKLAFGDEPQHPGAPAGMLVFDIELLAIR